MALSVELASNAPEAFLPCSVPKSKIDRVCSLVCWLALALAIVYSDSGHRIRVESLPSEDTQEVGLAYRALTDQNHICFLW